MAFLIKDSDIVFIGCFGETSENQFSFLATNCEKFFSEKLSIETLTDRTEEMNESIRYKQSKVIKTLQEESSVSCAVSNVGDALRIDLKFDVNNRPLNIYFKLTECEMKDVGPLFTVGLMKSAIENSLMVEKLHKAVEAKDLEIEEYKRAGATLVRGKVVNFVLFPDFNANLFLVFKESLATKKFEFEAEATLSQLQLIDGRFTINPSPLFKKSNIQDLCAMIRAENVSNAKEKVKAKLGTEAKGNSQLRGRNASRIPVAPKPIEKKPLEYVNDDEAEPDQEALPSAEVAKKPRLVRKLKVNL